MVSGIGRHHGPRLGIYSAKGQPAGGEAEFAGEVSHGGRNIYQAEPEGRRARASATTATCGVRSIEWWSPGMLSTSRLGASSCHASVVSWVAPSGRKRTTRPV